ncbi:MAG TPA: cobalamin biosynthesis protein [Gemmatales bacterium]|nr:cobalamin biosynthesis protein [Gemmatales bacterium]
MPTPIPLMQHAQQRGWQPDDPLALEIIAKLIDRQPVTIVQQAGSRAWVSEDMTILDDVPHNPDPAVPLVIISDRLLGPRPEVDRLVVLRPPTLTLGIASRCDLKLDELEEAARLLCRRSGFSLQSVMAVAASARRRHVCALDDYAEQLKVPLLLYDDAVLKRTPWTAPGKMAGTCAVSAILAAGAREPVVQSMPFFGKMTLAMAKRKE